MCICRQFQWTRTRKRSRLTMARPRAMTSSLSRQAAGQCMKATEDITGLISVQFVKWLLINRFYPLEQKVWMFQAWSWTTSRCWRPQRTPGESTQRVWATTSSSWEPLLLVLHLFLHLVTYRLTRACLWWPKFTVDVFPGMEIASYLIDKASSITVIGSSEMPYQNTLGPEIGKVTMMVQWDTDFDSFCSRFD